MNFVSMSADRRNKFALVVQNIRIANHCDNILVEMVEDCPRVSENYPH